MPIDMLPRAQVHRAQWDAFVRQHADGWWFHTSDWLDYARLYTPSASDRSLAACDAATGEVVGVAPLLLSAAGVAVNGGQLPVQPLVREGAALEAWGLRTDVDYASRPNRRHNPLLWQVETRHTFVVELKPREAMWAAVRKSYRALIHGAEKEFGIVVIDRPVPPNAAAAMADAREVHTAEAGRLTRDLGTWHLQELWLQRGDALLALAYRGDEPVAFAYTIRWKGWSYYASGASRERNVMHALLWHTMLVLQADSETKWFEVGHDADPEATDKERGIAFFKAGFGGERWPYYVGRRG